MNLLLASTVLLAVFSVSTSFSVNREAGLKPRSYGNFGPDVKKSFTSLSPASRPASLGVAFSPVDIALRYFVAETKTMMESIVVTNSHTSDHNGVTHVYLQQLVNGVAVANGVANVNVNKHGGIISVGNSFYEGSVSIEPAQIRSQLSASQAVHSFAQFLNLEDSSVYTEATLTGVHSILPAYTVSGASFAVKEIPAQLKYLQVDGALSLVWDIQVETADNMYNAFVEANNGVVLSLIDWVSDASYRFYPVGMNDPRDGERSLVEDPASPIASPNGWHRQGSTDYTNTIGNNVFAQENLANSNDYLNQYRPNGTASLTFDYPIDLGLDPSQYLDGAITNLFVWNNVIHDLLYVYGFNERTGNFQEDNRGLGGVGNDAVIANAQDGSGTNNANFATPPDGQKGRMRMYVWTATSPRRDGDLDNGIIVHEYCHGLSIRLTGGPSNVNCLGFGESGGMGEGWGDTIATILRVNASTTREQNFGMGDYSAGGTTIRKYDYSTNMVTNPSTYSFVLKSDYTGVHAKGEVWAVILYEVFWNLVEKHGFNADWYNTRSGGNAIFLQLLIDGMKLQPCNPNFVNARNAIISADEVDYDGANRCELWRGFAKRGLGVSAMYQGIDDFTVPAGC